MNLNFDFADIPDSYFETFAETEKVNAKKTRAYKTKGRVTARRATAETTLNEILPAVIEPGDAWHILSSGDIDSLSYLAHIVKTTPLDYCLFSTWCMAMEDVKQLGRWLESGQIKKLDAYVGEIFPNQYTDEHAVLCETMRRHGGRVCVFKNHSKIFCCHAKNQNIVIESSANINTNPRTENTQITADAGLLLHHKTYFDGVRSFNRDFDQWQPTQIAV